MPKHNAFSIRLTAEERKWLENKKWETRRSMTQIMQALIAEAMKKDGKAE